MAKVDDLFGGNATDEVPGKVSELYKVSYKNGKNGVYNSVIRFIPNPADPTKSIYKKYVAWVKNPITGVGMYIDNFSSPTQHSPITDMFFKMKNTKVPAFEQMAKDCLSSKVQYASFVQILSDENRPELVGQIKVFIYGQKIWDKLHSEEFPPQGVGINPFHPVQGRHFALNCVNQANFPNYDNSNFFDERDANKQVTPSGMWYLDPTTGQLAIATDNVDGDVLMSYLKANCTDLSKYDYAPQWTEQQTQHVETVLRIMENYLLTGKLVDPQQATLQNAGAVLHTQNNPAFPGVTSPVAPAVAPAAPVPSPAAMPIGSVAAPVPPVAPVVQPTVAPVAPVAPMPPVASVSPVAAPVAPVAPVVAPVAPMPGVVTPVAPQVNQPVPQATVTGVDIPVVTPQANYGAAAPGNTGSVVPGVNLDDILQNM